MCAGESESDRVAGKPVRYQNIDLQRNALTCANCDRIFEDRISGKIANRPGLKRALKYVN
ncbi:recombinase family protein, partial [Salmonella enterica subsp. enterica serovar Anatum]|nr:recombinase family protein [Salmonella enterica subsp. enterica serovar Anatum]